MLEGSLTIVGTGIRIYGHTTQEARSHMETADKLLYLVCDPVTEYWIQKLNSTAESLQDFYQQGKHRLETYLEMVDRIMECVREGKNVCVAFYGHPGVFVLPSHEAIRRARTEGFNAKMLPGVSAEDCLFADLGIDPGRHGCQSFEATDFLLYKRRFDPYCSLILWQIGVIGDVEYKGRFDLTGLRTLVDTLKQSYDPSHVVYIYEASQYPICDPRIEPVEINKISDAHVTPISTLYVPPKGQAYADTDMIATLGLPAYVCNLNPDCALIKDNKMRPHDIPSANS
jgi:hypothetical protein